MMMKILVNPILKIKTNFQAYTLEDRVYELNEDMSNFAKVFVDNYVNYIVGVKNQNNQMRWPEPFSILQGILDGSFNEGNPCYQEYAHWELQNAQSLQSAKAKHYIDLINKNEPNTYILDKIGGYFKLKEVDSLTFIGELYNKELIGQETKALTEELNKFSHFLLQWSRFNLLTYFNLLHEEGLAKKTQQIFSFKKIARHLPDQPEEKLNKLLIIKKQIENISSDFYSKSDIEEIIPPHRIIKQQLEKLINEQEIKMKQNTSNQFIVGDSETKIKSFEENYPKQVFKDKSAFQLFDALAQKMQKPVQFSFLFRYMSEAEQPPLIICRDAPFREWFNNQNYAVELEYTTKRLCDVENSDRLALYQWAKQQL
jgi:hypothetical protein